MELNELQELRNILIVIIAAAQLHAALNLKDSLAAIAMNIAASVALAALVFFGIC